MNIYQILILFLAIFLFKLAWDVFCVVRGYSKLNLEHRKLNYRLNELHDIGNPFCRYKGRSNF